MAKILEKLPPRFRLLFRIRKAQHVGGMDGDEQAAAAKFAQLAEQVKIKQQQSTSDSTQQLATLNAQLRAVEAGFLSEPGLPNRPWFKHTIYAPGEYTGYAAVVIPGVNEAIDAKDSSRAQQQMTVLIEAITKATTTLDAIAK